jgi:8-oxo-dGTP pyrophosphatase MutT (NUDIX family)
VVSPDQPHDHLLIGVVEQYRNKQGGTVLNVPRGFVQEGEEHDETATRELVEETGFQGRPFLLPGHPLNPNSAFFETGADGGCKVYGFCLTADQVEIDITGVVFPITDELPADKTGELIGKCRFIPIAEALRLGDMFSVAGAARLLLFLYFKK